MIQQILSLPRGSVVGISGFGGAGKSTLARRLTEETSIPCVSVDEFFVREITDQTVAWDCIGFDEILNDLILPLKGGASALKYKTHVWGTGAVMGRTLAVPSGKLIVEGIGLFRPGVVEHLDFKIWVECPQSVSTERGKTRDRVEYSQDHDALWDGLWKDLDNQYLEMFDPKQHADFVFDSA